MTDPLERVENAAKARELAVQEYRSAILEARRAGYSYPAIARAAGVTHPAILEMVKRAEDQNT